ncbi:MAG: DUF5700 domain-containing putative Zn-dependent protease [Candidatus Krumholzibacteriia bacterium]
MRYGILVAMTMVLLLARPASGRGSERIDIALELDQAEAVLELLAVRAAGDEVPDSLWTRLLASEGYRRVMERERGMNERFGLDRGIDDASFRAWALSGPAPAGLAERRAALDAWREVDLQRAGEQALAYLPAGTRLNGTIYPIVREQTNSFIWDLETEHPAIFMYVEPGRDAAELEHILAHELHHVGSAMAACPDMPAAQDRPAGVRQVRRWLTAFGEGIAVLAAAGGPDGDTHPFAGPDERSAWSARLDSLASDMVELEDFLLALLEEELTGDDAGRRGMSFITRPGAPAGPFYSVGWHMAATVERVLGREAVVEADCEPARLLLAYDRAAAVLAQGDPDASLPRWSPGFLERMERDVLAADQIRN